MRSCAWQRIYLFIYFLKFSIMKKTNLSIEFVQGANKLSVANVQIDSIKIDEIAFTLANKVLTARANMKRYKMSIKGFSFNRKFDVVLNIQGCEPVNISDLFGGIVAPTITLSAEANSFKRFSDIIYDMTFCAMTGANQNVIGKSEFEPAKLLN
jgi:hypothetical protein